MTNFSFNDAYRMISNVIDERIKALTKSGAGVDITWGQVAGLESDATCSVYIQGNPTPSYNFRIENGLQPNVGDPVRVSIDKRGNRWIDSILSEAALDYPKLAINPRDGTVKIGDGTVPPSNVLSGSYHHGGTHNPSSSDPVTFGITPLNASATVNLYPLGLSTFIGGTADGWPEDFVLISTIKWADARIMQFITAHQGTKAWMRYGHLTAFGAGTWSLFYSITPETTPVRGVKIDSQGQGYSGISFDENGARKAMIDWGTGTSEDLRILMGSTNTVMLTFPADATHITAHKEIKSPSEAWVAFPFANSWIDYGGSFSPAGYRKDAQGYVHLRGLIKGGAAIPVVVGNLPAGFRPAFTSLFGTTSAGNIAARVDVAPTGAVTVQAGSTTWVPLEGITFKAEN